jgi:hypothetical protein
MFSSNSFGPSGQRLAAAASYALLLGGAPLDDLRTHVLFKVYLAYFKKSSLGFKF